MRERIVFAVLIAALASEPAEAIDESEFRVSGSVASSPRSSAAGGEFELVREPFSASSGGEFELRSLASSALQMTPEGAICFCADPIFADGFESNDTSAWSLTEP